MAIPKAVKEFLEWEVPNKPASYLLATLLVLMIGIATFLVKTDDRQAWFYILSSISQGLAALLAIVLAVTFVVTQILQSSGQVRTSKPLLLHPATMLLVFLYSSGILFPLIAIQNPDELTVDSCIIWAAVCISSLFPYIYSVGREMSTKPGVIKVVRGRKKDKKEEKKNK